MDLRSRTKKTVVDEGRHPAFSPDGQSIVFEKPFVDPNRGWVRGVFRVRRVGGEATFLVEGEDPALSPDGGRVAFHFVRGQRDLDGLSPRRL